VPYRWPLWGVFAELLAKFWPSLLGAWVALQFHPPGAERRERIGAYVSSVAIALLFAPAFVEYFELETVAVSVAVHGVFAIFGLVLIGQLMAVLRHKWARGAIREFLRRWIGGAS
jgi:hypothetical protein